MARHPFHDVAIVGIHNTRQGRVLEDTDSRMITMDAAMGAVADAGLTPLDVDGVVGQTGSDFIYQNRIGPVWRSMSGLGIPAILEAAAAIATGMASVVVVAGGFESGPGEVWPAGCLEATTRPGRGWRCSGTPTGAETAEAGDMRPPPPCVAVRCGRSAYQWISTRAPTGVHS